MARPDEIGFWAENLVIDPTTGEPNRRVLTTDENNNGYVPKGVKPKRQNLNQKLYLSGQWEDHLDRSTARNSMARFVGYNNNGIDIKPNGILSPGDNTLVFGSAVTAASSGFTSNLPRISAICEEFAFATNDYLIGYHEDLSSMTKDQSLIWSAGAAGGLKSYGSAQIDQEIHVFLLTNLAGDFDYATDYVRDGANIRGNATIISAGFTHFKRICSILWYKETGSGTEKFIKCRSSHNNMMLLDDLSIIITASTTNTAFQPYLLQFTGFNGAVPFFDTSTSPNIKLQIRETGGASAGLVKGGFDTNEINMSANSEMITDFYLDGNIRLEYRSSAGSSFQLEAKWLGYKNPASEFGV